MIQVTQHPNEAARGARGCPWVAECQVDGERYTVESRTGAPYALARILVAAGIPDDGMVVVSEGLKGETRYRSFHKMAGYTIKEDVTGIRLGRFEEFGVRGRPGQRNEQPDTATEAV